MTRINTNVSSLTSQKTLAKSNAQLQTALTRLSTGLRINTGKDDPAGLIASEALRSDITATGRAITNSERANQVIATADSALGQVSSLLNDIRGLVTEAANTGGMSEDQIAADQLQLDASLDAINRIAQNTSFQGRRLLDGSLSFVTEAGAGMDTVTALQINSANLGATGTMGVDVAISSAATQASLTATVPTTIAASKASTVWTLGLDTLTITADATGPTYNGVTFQVHESASVADGKAVATFNGTDHLDLYLSATADDETTLATIKTAIDATPFVATIGGTGDAKYKQGVDAPGTMGTTAGGAAAVSGLTNDLVFELVGDKGTQAFNFEAATTGDQMAAAINLVSDATGVTAGFVGTTLTFTSAAYGSKSLVAVNVINEGGATPFTTSLSATRDNGTDIVATVNGYAAKGDGNTLSVNTATLAMSATVDEGSSTAFDFDITGGGAMFQLGPDVVSNQQARVGIQSMNTATLGGSAGRLYQLASGGNATLDADPTTAYQIVDQVISTVTGLRGRLGAFQKTTLDSNAASLKDTQENLIAAESNIRDADFAAESANLTRAQILVQSGMSVLGIANQAPQAVLALLR